MTAGRPREDEQVAIRAELVAIHADLLQRAAVLVGGLRPPRPDPGDLVNTVVARILRKYRDGDVRTTMRQLGYTSLGRLTIDIIRRRKEALLDEEAEIEDDRGDVGDPLARARLQKLAPRDQCVLARVNLERVAVPKAFELCGWHTRSPYPEYRKLLDRMYEVLGETA